MKLDQPLGDSAIAAFLVRVPLGTYLLMSGWAKIDGSSGFVDPDFVRQIQSLRVIPDNVAAIYSILLPYFEIMTGAFMIIGFWTIFSAFLSAVIFAIGVYLFGIFTTPGKHLINKDLLLLMVSISLLYSGAGAISIDKFRRGS